MVYLRRIGSHLEAAVGRIRCISLSEIEVGKVCSGLRGFEGRGKILFLLDVAYDLHQVEARLLRKKIVSCCFASCTGYAASGCCGCCDRKIR